MFLTIFSAGFGITALGTCVLYRVRARRRARVLESATHAGLAIDECGNVDAGATYAAMASHEIDFGEAFDGKKSRFMELMRICSKGPQTIDEIRLLFQEGIDPVVRPDGLVYVPCLENEHLYMEGEVELIEEDLDHFIKRQAVKLGLVPEPMDPADDEHSQA